MPKLAPFCAAAALVAAMASQAAAQSTLNEVVVHGHYGAGVEVKSQRVGYRDLDLRSPEGVQTLLGRVRQAVQNVCEPAPTGPGSLKDLADYQQCASGAMHDALAQVPSPALASLYDRVG